MLIDSIKNEIYLKIYFQNITNSTEGYFNTSDEAIYSKNPNRYSLLSTLGRHHRDSDGKYTFALVYDELSLYNIWQQSNNPIHEQNVVGNFYNVSGYNPIELNIFRSDEYCTFGGLVNAQKRNLLLHGCAGSTSWFYAIGYTGKIEHTPKIPSNHTSVNIVSLWVKYNIIEPRITCFCSYSSTPISRLMIYVIILM